MQHLTSFQTVPSATQACIDLNDSEKELLLQIEIFQEIDAFLISTTARKFQETDIQNYKVVAWALFTPNLVEFFTLMNISRYALEQTTF